MADLKTEKMICAVRRDEPEAADQVLAAIVKRAEAQGLMLGGVIQRNIERIDRLHNDMELIALGCCETFRISEDRGRHSSGCRLDRDVIARAAQEVERAVMRDKPDLLVLNKFGKAEEEGRGMRGAMAMALERDIPIFMTVGRLSVGALEVFADDLVRVVGADFGEAHTWYQGHFARCPSKSTDQCCLG